MFSVPENTCQGLSPWTPSETNREAKSWGGRRADPVRSPPGFHHKRVRFLPTMSARSRRQPPCQCDSISCHLSLRNPSLPAGIIVTGATPTGESGDRHPQCQLKRVSSAARATKKWGRSRHSLPLPTGAEQGFVH